MSYRLNTARVQAGNLHCNILGHARAPQIPDATATEVMDNQPIVPGVMILWAAPFTQSYRNTRLEVSQILLRKNHWTDQTREFAFLDVLEIE